MENFQILTFGIDSDILTAVLCVLSWTVGHLFVILIIEVNQIGIDPGPGRVRTISVQVCPEAWSRGV